MSEWMRKLHWRQIFISGFWYLVVASIVQQIEVAFTMDYYKNPAYSGLWSRLMMPAAGPPPAIFFVISLTFTYITGCTLAAVFDFTRTLSKTYWLRVVNFTDIVVGLSIVLTSFPMYLLFNVPVALLAWWLGATFVTTFVSAMIFAKLMK